MADKKLLLVLNGSLEYIRHVGSDEKKYLAEENRLFEAISFTYIPLLKAFENLEKDGIDFTISMVLSPVLCTLLDDKKLQEQYLVWLEKRIEFGKKEIERVASSEKLLACAKVCLEKACEEKEFFVACNGKIVKKILEYHKKGRIELLASCGTDIFLPHYNDMPEIMSAQVETGIYAFRNFFGEIPEGFWLPELGYYRGVEKILGSYGLNYTILDSRSFLFSENEPSKGIFYPARFDNALVAYGRDSFSDEQIFGECGYANNSCYLNANLDVGFELPSSELSCFWENDSARFAVGYKYWNKKVHVQELKNATSSDNSFVYDSKTAYEQIVADAQNFVCSKEDKLSKAQELLSDSKDVYLTVTIDLDRLRTAWCEGVNWIEQVVRQSAKSSIKLSGFKNNVENPFTLQRIRPYYGSSRADGYGEDLLSSKNSWMMRYVRKASERMVDLANRFPSDTGLKARLLILGAKELMLAQSCCWAKMIENEECPEYAAMRFKQSINDFTAVFDALGSNTVSTEWLTKLEEQHPIFPWMNYRIFSKKR